MSVRLLLVDDDQVDRLAVKRLLRQTALDVNLQETVEGKAGLERLRNEAFDCVLLDYRLPDMDGVEFLTALAELPVLQRPAVVMLTGKGNTGIAVDVMKRGLQDYLVKDTLQADVLAQSIRRAMDMVTLQRQHLRAEERFRKVSEATPAALIMVNRQSHIVFANLQAERLFGYQRHELLGQAVEVLVPGHLRQQHKNSCATFFDQPAERRMGYGRYLLGQRQDGSVFPVEIGLIPLEMEEGPVVLSTIVDMTERQRLEAERQELVIRTQQAKKLESLTSLTAGVAHDFNNLLAGMLGYTEIIMMEMAPNTAVQDYLHQLQQVISQAARLVQQMLMYTGQGRLSSQSINLVSLLQDMLPTFQAALPQHVELTLMPVVQPVPPIQGEPEQVCQALGNLLTNAAEAMGETSGRISITLGSVIAQQEDLVSLYLAESLPPGLYVEVSVTDTGCGMDDVTLNKIFDPFFSTKFLGRGLGLAAVLGVVRSHRGTVHVQSAPGQGTKVRLLFPSTEMAMEDLESHLPLS